MKIKIMGTTEKSTIYKLSLYCIIFRSIKSASLVNSFTTSRSSIAVQCTVSQKDDGKTMERRWKHDGKTNKRGTKDKERQKNTSSRRNKQKVLYVYC
jgi:hypothetical protein